MRWRINAILVIAQIDKRILNSCVKLAKVIECFSLALSIFLKNFVRLFTQVISKKYASLDLFIGHYQKTVFFSWDLVLYVYA